jgi:hypothetical protein
VCHSMLLVLSVVRNYMQRSNRLIQDRQQGVALAKNSEAPACCESIVISLSNHLLSPFGVCNYQYTGVVSFYGHWRTATTPPACLSFFLDEIGKKESAESVIYI